jgi:hypothetical protein
MGVNLRWDRCAAVFLLLATSAMTGCQGLSGGGGSAPSQSGTVSAGSSSLNFGNVVVGSSKAVTDTLTNGTTANITITSVVASDPEFAVTAPTLPLVLAAGQSTNLSIAFTPSAAGKPSGKLALMEGLLGAAEIDLAVAGNALSVGTLAITPGSLAFGNVRIGQSQVQTATLTNSGQSSVTISQASASSSVFTLTGLTFPVTLAAGQGTNFTVVFAPKNPGAVTGNISVNGQASLSADPTGGQSGAASKPTAAALAVSGDGTTAGQLALNPSSLSFGSVTIGSSQSQTVTLSNAGGTSTTISSATVSGAGFSLSGLATPLILAAGQSSSFRITFAPNSAGPVAGSIAIGSTAANSNLTAALTGTATTPGALSANPASLSFGGVAVGSSQSQTGSVTNPGGSSVTLSQATVSGAGFSVGGLALPITLSPGQTTSFSVTFAPQAAGNLNGTVAFVSNVATINVALAGTGLAPGSLVAKPASVNFGNVQIGSSQPLTITLTNGGSSSVTISQAAASGPGFSVSGLALPLTLQAGQSTSFTATFAPGASGSTTGNVAIASSATNSQLNVGLSGTGVTAGLVGVNPTSVSFGTVQVGSTQMHTDVITNSGGSSVSISNATLTGAGFSTSGLNVPLTLAAGQSLTFNIIFSPHATGSVSGNLALTATGSVSSVNISLSASGGAAGQLSITPATVSFGNVTVGASQSQTGTLTASGASVTISSAASNNAEFGISGLALPLTLNAGQSASFTLSFTPQASGAASGSLTFASNAANTPVVASLTGTGMLAPQHSVSLSWTASTSTVVGYNVYRGAQTGGPYTMISSGSVTGTVYTDSTVQAAQTYYYVVTAVDGSGGESVYSNQVQAVIPSP